MYKNIIESNFSTLSGSAITFLISENADGLRRSTKLTWNKHQLHECLSHLVKK